MKGSIEIIRLLVSANMHICLAIESACNRKPLAARFSTNMALNRLKEALDRLSTTRQENEATA